tara:strand:+ start:9129 stop:11015 length:1887 start_codon:yes stop_codon:yes gene_type:complete
MTANCKGYKTEKGCYGRWQDGRHTNGKGPLTCKWSGKKCETHQSCSEDQAVAAQAAAAAAAQEAAQAAAAAKQSAKYEQCKMDLNKQSEYPKWTYQGVERDCPNYQTPVPACIITQASPQYDKNNTRLEINNVAENNIDEQDSNGYLHDQTKCTYLGCTNPDASNYADIGPENGTVQNVDGHCIIEDTPITPSTTTYEECDPSFNEITQCNQNDNNKTACEGTYEDTKSGFGTYCVFTPDQSVNNLSGKTQAEINPGKTGFKTGVGCSNANSGGTALFGLRADRIDAAGPANNDLKQIESLSANQILEKCKKVAESKYGENGYSGITVTSTGGWNVRGCDIFYNQDKLLKTTPRDGTSCYVNPGYIIKGDNTSTNGTCEPSGPLCQIPQETIIQRDEPTITLLGENPIKLFIGTQFIDPGATSQQFVNGESIDLTTSIKVEGSVNTWVASDYTLKYSVTDPDGQYVEKIRDIEVMAKNAPILTLNGDKNMEIMMNQKFTDPRATATHNGKDITNDIKIEGKVDMKTPNYYTITYSVTADMITTKKYRTIKVVDELRDQCKEKVYRNKSCEEMNKDMCGNNSVSAVYYGTPYHCSWNNNKCQKSLECGTRDEPINEEAWLQRLGHRYNQ